MAEVNITKRVQIEGKGWRFCQVVVSGNGKIKPNAVLIDGQEEIHPEGRYYIDFLENGQRKRLAAGATAAEAQHKADHQKRLMTAHEAAAAAGIALAVPKPEITAGRSLQTAVETYLNEVKAHKKRKTFSAYRTALTYFLDSCHKQTLEEITRADMLAFKSYLRSNGQSGRSSRNKFENVMTFLKLHKVTDNLNITKHDWPKFTQEVPETYKQEELDLFFANCNETETVWFKFFLFTGMREQEVMHVSWSDINFERKVVIVRENKQFGWTPKNNKSREIAVNAELIGLLKNWRAQADRTCGLVFPTTGCKPKQNFLDECKLVAKRAGLNPESFWLHKFRATRATKLLQGKMPITNVMRQLGHTDLKSTMRYQGEESTDIIQQQVEQIDAIGK